MSIIPLDVQRRCEQRWAARFSRPTELVAPRNQRPGEGEPADRRGTTRAKEENPEVEAVGSKPLPAA